jgi:hypothetical protein
MNSSPKRLGVNVFTAPAKAVVGERPRPFGEPLAWDPITSTLIYGEYDAVLVETLDHRRRSHSTRGLDCVAPS